MGESSPKLIAFRQPVNKPHYSHSTHMPYSTQQQLWNVMQRYDRMMLERPEDAAKLLDRVDLLMRHVYGA